MEHASSSEALAEPEDTARDESLQQSSDLGQACKWIVGTAERADACILRRLAHCENKAVPAGVRFVEGPPWRRRTRKGGATRRAFCFLLIQFILTVPIWPNLLHCRSSTSFTGARWEPSGGLTGRWRRFMRCCTC